MLCLCYLSLVLGTPDYAGGPVRLSTHVVIHAGHHTEAVDTLRKAAAVNRIPKTQYHPIDSPIHPTDQYPRLKSYYDSPNGGHVWGIQSAAGKPLFYIFTPRQYADRVQAIRDHFMQLINEQAAVLENNGSKLKLRSDISHAVLGALCEMIAPGVTAPSLGRMEPTSTVLPETIKAIEAILLQDPIVQERVKKWAGTHSEGKTDEDWSRSQKAHSPDQYTSGEEPKAVPKQKNFSEETYMRQAAQDKPPSPQAIPLPKAYTFEAPTNDEETDETKELRKQKKREDEARQATLHRERVEAEWRAQERFAEMKKEEFTERLKLFELMVDVIRDDFAGDQRAAFKDLRGAFLYEKFNIRYEEEKANARLQKLKEAFENSQKQAQQEFINYQIGQHQQFIKELEQEHADILQQAKTMRQAQIQEQQEFVAKETELRQQAIHGHYETVKHELTQMEIEQRALLTEQQEQKMYTQKKMFEKYINNPQKFDQMYTLREKLEQLHVAQEYQERFEQYADTLSIDELKTFLTLHVQKLADILSIIRQISQYPCVTKNIVTLLEELAWTFLDPHFETLQDQMQEAIFGLLWFDSATWQNWSTIVTDYQQKEAGTDLYSKIIELTLLEKETAMKGSKAAWILFNEEAGVQIRSYEEFSSKVKENIELVNLFFRQINPKLRQLLDLNHFSAQEHNNILRGMSMALLGAMYAPEYKAKAIQVIRDYMNTPRPAEEPIETIVLRELQEPKLYQALGNNMLFNQLARPVRIQTNAGLSWKMPTQEELCTFMLFHTKAIRSPLIKKIKDDKILSEEEIQQYGQRIYESVMLLPVSVRDTFKFLLGSELTLSQKTQTHLWIDFVQSFQISACYNATANKIAEIGSHVRTVIDVWNYSTLAQHKLLSMPVLSTVLNTFEAMPFPIRLQQFTKEQAKIQQNRTNIEQEYQQWKTSITFGTFQSHGIPQSSIETIRKLLTHPETNVLMYTEDEILEALFWEAKISSSGTYPPISICAKYGFIV